MAPIANRPVMEHILRLLSKHQITDVVSNLHYMPEKITSYFGDGEALNMRLSYHIEEKLSGDAGGVRACHKFFDDGTFVVINGDLLTDVDLTKVIKEHKAKGAIASIALKPMDDVSRFGVAVLDSAGFIKGFQEKPAKEEALSNLISTGIYIFEPEIFNHIPKEGEYGFGRQLLPKLVQMGLPVLGVEVNCYWSDVGTIPQYRLSNFDAIEGLVDIALPGERTTWGFAGNGCNVQNVGSIKGSLMMGKNSTLSKGVIINGSVIIGDNCTVGENAVLENSIVWSDTNIESHARVHDSVIGYNCLVENGSVHLETAKVVPLVR
jgi:mannose-1-phosphate guanylyltransferase/mannose-1-phosphate guanylyltransferase/phosphomannomutase